MNAWASESEPSSPTTGAITLVEGSSFCVCSPSGDLTGSGGMAPGDMEREYRDKTQGDMTKPSQPDGTTPLEHDQGQRTKVR